MLARERTLRVGIDSAEAAEALSAAAAQFASTIGILVDLDLGFGRTGVQTPDEARQARPRHHVDCPACGSMA